MTAAMTAKSILAGAIIMVSAMAAPAQTLLGGAEISKKLPLGLSAGAGVEYRSMNWLKNTEQWSAEASLGYKPIKYLKVGVGYKFIQACTPAGENSDGYTSPRYWDSKHRVSVSLTGQWKPSGKLTLSLRERWQYTYRPAHDVPQFNEGFPWGNKTVSEKSTHILRSRLQAEYKPRKKSRWTPFVNFELYSRMAEINHTKSKRTGAAFCDKWRLAAGTEFKINKRNGLELFYRYANQSEPDENDSAHTIALVYSFSL